MNRFDVATSSTFAFLALVSLPTTSCDVYSEELVTTPADLQDAAADAAALDADASAQAESDAVDGGELDGEFDGPENDASAGEAEGVADSEAAASDEREAAPGCSLLDRCECRDACAPSCNNGVMDGEETGIDCGGGCPSAACATGSACTAGVACTSGYCRNLVCADDTAVRLFGSQAMSFRRPVQDDFTIELWVNTTQATTGAQWGEGGYLFQADAAGSENDFGTSVLNGRFAFGTGNPELTVLSATRIDTGKWIHVAATRTRSTGLMSTFVNGVYETSVSSANRSALSAGALGYLGAQRLTDPGYVGELDEVRVWNIARTATEIKTTMNKRLTGSEDNLVGYWRMDDGPGPKFVDSSKSKNDATWTISAEPTRVTSGVPMTPSP